MTTRYYVVAWVDPTPGSPSPGPGHPWVRDRKHQTGSHPARRTCLSTGRRVHRHHGHPHRPSRTHPCIAACSRPQTM